MREILSGYTHPKTKTETTFQVAEYPHLNFINLQHLQETLAFAKTLGEHAFNSLQQQFARLERACVNCNETADVHPDGAPHCFYYVCFKDGKFSNNGGILLFGLPKINTFSVQLNPSTEPEWSTHT